MHVFKYVSLNAYVYSSILQLLCIPITVFKLLLLVEHRPSGLGPVPATFLELQPGAEPLMKAVSSPLLEAEP